MGQLPASADEAAVPVQVAAGLHTISAPSAEIHVDDEGAPRLGHPQLYYVLHEEHRGLATLLHVDLRLPVEFIHHTIIKSLDCIDDLLIAFTKLTIPIYKK